MNLARLTRQNIAGNAFRSWAVFLCACVVGAFALGTTLIVRGAEDSLQLAMRRLGADLVIVPMGTDNESQAALLAGKPGSGWLRESTVAEVRAVPGVAAASPQLYFPPLPSAPGCPESELYVVAFDPQSDFTVTPWLPPGRDPSLGRGEAWAGNCVRPEGGALTLQVHGYMLHLRENLAGTGTEIDSTVFITLETARELARVSGTQAATHPLAVPGDAISAVMVRLEQGADSRRAAIQIMEQVHGITPILGRGLYQTLRSQMAAQLTGILAVLASTWGAALLAVALVYSMAANERRREIAVLRALGATRGFVFRMLLSEATVLALGGGLAGVTVALAGLYFGRDFVAGQLGLPLVWPAWPWLAALVAVGLGLALANVALAVLIPAFRISREDTTVTMRE